MKSFRILLCTGVGVAALSTSAWARDAAEQGNSLAERTDDIVVTARRKEERLQDVPQTVTAVSGNELQKLNILNFSDIDNVVAGLQVDASSFGVVSTRGITFNALSNAVQPTVTQYFNDAPTVTHAIIKSIYDIGQIEVLKGPQGTLHGVSSPSGAISLTTRRPDLDKIGGYMDVSVTNRHAHNIQGGFNIPLIADKLAVRIAALQDVTDGDGIYSVNSRVKPNSKQESARISIRFEPTDNISANVMYQYLESHNVGFSGGIFGPGGSGGNVNAPPNYNGTALGMFDRLSAASEPTINRGVVQFLTGELDWTFLGQRLSYVGSFTSDDDDTSSIFGSGGANTLPGYAGSGYIRGPVKRNTHELRLSSVDRVAGIFDYVAGVYHSHEHITVDTNQGAAALLSGFFGPPGTIPNPRVFNPRYSLNVIFNAPRTTTETSFFANVTAHLGEKWEISGGVRHIIAKTNETVTITTTPGFTTAAVPAAVCGGIGGAFGATYAGVCDIPVAASTVLGPQSVRFHHTPWIYQATLSYHFYPDLLGYLNTGSSWREGPFTVGIVNFNNDPTLNSLTFLQPETSKSYEAGVKWTFLEHRAYLNLAYYHQTFSGLIYTSPFPVNYYNGNPNAVDSRPYNFNSNVPAKVDGIDLEIGAQITRRWTVSGNFSWSRGRLSGTIPCNDSNFDGIPDGGVPSRQAFIAAGKSVAFCQSDASTSTGPRWNFSIQSEYDHPIAAHADGFIRGLFGYQPRNPNASQSYTIPACGLLNLYLGVRDPDRRWEVSLFGKNITSTTKVIAQGAIPIQPFASATTLPLFGPSGYTSVSLTPRREFGLNVRYAFGSD